MIVWTGFGILTPFIFGFGILVVTSVANSHFGPSYASIHFWVSSAGFAFGGFLCWIIGRALRDHGSRVIIDKASGEETTLRRSHTLFFIPMHWIGILGMIMAVVALFHGTPDATKPKVGMVDAASDSEPSQQAPLRVVYPSAAGRSNAAPSPAFLPGSATPPEKLERERGVQSPVFASVAKAQHEAVRLYPALGVAGSDFNRKFLALNKRYQAEKPEYFRDPNWPVTMAKEVAHAGQ